MIELSVQATQIVGTIINIIYIGVIIGTIIVVILDNRNPVKTMAWVLVLMFLPLVGLIFYFFFGRNTRREKLINRKSYDRLLKKPMSAYNAQKPEEAPESYRPLIHFFGETNESLPFQATDIDIYTNGYTKIKAFLGELQKAKDHIHIQYYIILDDAIGRMIKDALIEKAEEGVEIRVIYDDVGSWKTPNVFFEEMRDAGIEVRSFLKVRFPLFTSKVNYRNHRKMAIIDGNVGFVGGMNLAERYVKGTSWGGVWRDTHIRLRGRAVHGLQTAFLLDWYFADQTLITSSRYFPRIETTDSILTQVVTSNPVDPWKKIMQGLTIAITTAKKYVYIQTPYFLPSETIIVAMQSAALAGIDVRLMLPERSDNRITQWGSHSYLKDVLRAGVKVYFYRKGFLHAKVMVSDDMLSTVGSTNIDFRSFEHNFEVNVFMYNTETAIRLKEIFMHDQRECVQLSLKKWQMRPWHQKAIESVIRLLAPLL